MQKCVAKLKTTTTTAAIAALMDTGPQGSVSLPCQTGLALAVNVKCNNLLFSLFLEKFLISYHHVVNCTPSNVSFRISLKNVEACILLSSQRFCRIQLVD